MFVYRCMDDLVTLEIRPPSMPRGVVRKMYQEARGNAAEPLVYTIADALLTKKATRVGIATGGQSPTLPKGENDGPLGSVSLANALATQGHHVLLMTDEPLFPVLTSLASVYSRQLEMVPLVPGKDNEYEELADQLDVLVAIERLGSNPIGVLHSMTGTSRDGTRAKIDGLVNRMNSLGKLTVGIGDGGNEIGFGTIRERVKDLVPFGEVCKCPCGRGVLSATPTTFLYPVSVSNWGAYALVAAIAVMTRDLSLAHTADREREFFRASLEHDLRDGQLGRNAPYVDGIHAESSAAVCQILWNLAESEIRGTHPSS